MVGSLFSGCGGFDMGLEGAGMEIVWQVEYDEQAQTVLRYHWPNVDLHKDVCDVGAGELVPVDLICGGFPCQDLSVAGRRSGLDGDRSGLFYEFMRIVDKLAPGWVLIENVPGLLSSNGGRDMGAVLGTLGELGYGYTYRVLDTQFFGPPQRRKRVFIVGRAGGVCSPEVLLEPEGLPWNPAPSRESREGVARGVEGGAGDVGGVRANGHPPSVAFAAEVSPTMNASAAGTSRPGGPRLASEEMYHPCTPAPRRLTPRECERLQGWPDDWTRYGRTPDGRVIELADSPRYRMCGNGVSAPVAEWIGRRILEAGGGP